ncbi:putative ankyrin repeat protein RF_0381 [Trichonephila clavipes]|nr:putative ankyrin repeat protein RF_0381 [Trichonephila clavipes]
MARNKMESNRKHGKQAIDVWDIMAYFAPDKIHIEEIFSKLIADDEEKLWGAVELLDKYEMIALEAGKLGEIVNVENNYGQTPLHIAAENGKLNVVECLVNKGANINAKRSGCTPLQVAADNGELDIIKYLLDKDIVKYLVSKDADINAKDKYGRTPLHFAVKSGNLDIVKYLIKNGADVNTKNRYNWTLLHEAAAHDGQLDIVRYLVDKGADVNARDKRGNTPLYMTVYHEELDIIKYLIDNGANVNVKNKHDETFYFTVLPCMEALM